MSATHPESEGLVRIATWSEVPDRQPTGATADGVELVIIRRDDTPHVLFGRCLHRGALLSDGRVVGEDLVCGLHGWDYRIESGVSAYANDERLECFAAVIADDGVHVSRSELADFLRRHPQAAATATYQGRYHSAHDDSAEEPFVSDIRRLATTGLERVGSHGPVSAMGVPRDTLPSWDAIQIVTAQLATLPLFDEEEVGTDVTVGPGARRPLRLRIPLIVSDMSFGAISEEAAQALGRGAEIAGTGICSGEGGMLPEVRDANSRYLYELASGRFGWEPQVAERVQALHFKFGQGAKTGTGGHLPGAKVTGRIAEVRGLTPGAPAISPARFPDWDRADLRAVADDVRARSGGIPVGAKLSAQHIEDDIDAALAVGVDYVILDGRGGGTGAAPLLFRDNISVPTIPALARARAHLDRRDRDDVTLIITGGLRTAADFAKALALGADAVAIANSALQAIGCVGMRACHTNNCPVGIATQQPHLRARLPVEEAAERLGRYLSATVELMRVLARACGHRHLSEFSPEDLTTFDREMAHLSGIRYGGVTSA